MRNGKCRQKYEDPWGHVHSTTFGFHILGHDGEIEESMDNEEELDFFKTTPMTAERDNGGTSLTFEVDEYTAGERLLIGRFLTTLTLDLLWTNVDSQKIRTKAYIYFLRGHLWKHPKKRLDTVEFSL